MDGVAAEHKSARIYIAGIRSSSSRPLNGVSPSITGSNHKLMIRGIVNPPNDLQWASITIHYLDLTANEIEIHDI